MAAGGIDTSGQGHDGGNEHGHDGEWQGQRHALGDQLDHRGAIAVAIAQIPMQQTVDPVQVALPGRLVQAQLLGQFGDGFGCSVGAHQHLGGVAGQDLQHQKDHN